MALVKAAVEARRRKRLDWLRYRPLLKDEPMEGRDAQELEVFLEIEKEAKRHLKPVETTPTDIVPVDRITVRELWAEVRRETGAADAALARLEQSAQEVRDALAKVKQLQGV